MKEEDPASNGQPARSVLELRERVPVLRLEVEEGVGVKYPLSGPSDAFVAGRRERIRNVTPRGGHISIAERQDP